MELSKTKAILAVLLATAALGARAAAAQDVCVLFPLGVGPEEVCATGILPSDDPIQVGPGDTVALPLVEYVNDTDRPMTFTIEAVGSVISSGGHSVTLAPGETASFQVVPVLVTDDDAPIGTMETIQVGWSAFGSLSGEPEYVVTVQQDFAFLVGPDSDGDGLVDSWEAEGYDPDDDGIIDVDLPAMGADPLHKDMFVEIDWEAAIPPRKASLDAVRAVFAAAPVDTGGVANPDGLPGVDVHFDTGSLTDGFGNLVGDPEFAGALGGGTQIPDGPWVFGRTCFQGLDDGRGCHPDDNPCDLAVEGDGLGVCESGFYRARGLYFDAAARRFLFRYVIMQLGHGPGQGELGGDDLWLGTPSDATLLHELGHTLNLSHGGEPTENGKRNCEPNYVSIMNYRYPRLMRVNGVSQIDFSPAQLSGGGRARVLDDLEEASLAEEVVDPTDAEHVISFVGPPEICSAVCNGGPRDGRRCADDDACADPDDPAMSGTCGGVAQEGASCTAHAQCGGGRCGGRNKTAPIGQPLDWNLNGIPGETVVQSVDGTFVDEAACGNEAFAAELTTLTAYDDWRNVRLRFRPSPLSADAPVDPILEPELTDAQIAEVLEVMSTADLEIEKLGPAGPLEAQALASLAYELVVSNAGPALAGTVRVRDELPAGFSVVGLDPHCTEPEAAVVECETVALPSGGETSFPLDVEGAPACQNGLPMAIQNVASVENASEFAGDDPDPSDNVSVLETEVVDTTPPELTVEVVPMGPWPPNHKLQEVTVTLAATDACDDDPEIRLVSVVSNEADDGVGDGSTTDDIQGADLGTADTSLLLRSERSGTGSGRTYTLTYEAEDASGNVTRVSKTVTVAHHQDP